MRPRAPAGWSAEEPLGEAARSRGREHPDGGLEPFGENDSIGQRRAEPRRDREAVLRVEVVLVLTEKRQSGLPLERGLVCGSERAGVVRWEEPHHPGPVTNLGRHANPLCPTLQHIRARELDRIRRTELLARRRSAENRMTMPFAGSAEGLGNARVQSDPANPVAEKGTPPNLSERCLPVVISITPSLPRTQP
jgi:hypothetical protein